MSDEGPDAFVARVLEGLRAAEDRAAGASVLAAVAAPRLLATAGGEAGLARVLANPLFEPLLEAQRLEPANLQRIEATARVQIEAFDAGGPPARFTMSLARRAERGAPEWRVTGLVRAERSDA